MTAFDLATLDIISPDHYVRHGYPHPEWKYLRRHAPVFWYEGRTDVDPFWAITKHADVIELSKQPELFQNEPELAIFPNEFAQPEENPARHLLNMDPPDHGKYRRAAAKQFTPRTVTELAPHVDEMTREILDAAAAKGQGDFVADISAPLTIGVIADMLGVPAADRPLMFRWTNEVIAPTDPEFQRGLPEETLEKARLELFAYFKNLSDERRKRPTPGHREHRRERQRRRPPAARLRAALLLPAARRRRQRDHAQRHDGRHARLHREPGRVAEAAARTRRSSTPRWRRSCAGPRR